MTDLTEEAVKDMLHHHEKGRAHNETGFTRLELNVPDLARDWLRLKKVEKAARTLAFQCDRLRAWETWAANITMFPNMPIPEPGDTSVDEVKNDFDCAIAAFRAATECD